jgi:hypothetical protein
MGEGRRRGNKWEEENAFFMSSYLEPAPAPSPPLLPDSVAALLHREKKERELAGEGSER